jgi:N-acetylglucosaminyl-diphospho-decaprenol L-rhamnosyltransferase
VTWYNRRWPALPPKKKSKHHPAVGAIVTSYNTRDLLRDCLRSLNAQVGVDGLSVWVVDSASRDGSPEMVRREFPDVRLIALPKNVLYVRLNNVGLRDLMAAEPRPRNVLLLNGDTELAPGTLAHLLRVLEEYPDVGAVGPRLALPNGEIDWACRRGFPSPSTSFFHMSGLARLFPRSRLFGRYRLTFLDERAVADVDSLVGAFMLVRTEVLQRVGLFDEAFLMYGEDLDLARRIREAGWRVLYDGRIDVLHHKRASSKQNPRARVHFWHAMQVFFRKHYAEGTPKPLRLLIECAIGLAWALTAMRLRRQVAG